MENVLEKTYVLMNCDTPVLKFNPSDPFKTEVFNNDLLPYEFKDYIVSADGNLNFNHYNCIRDFLSNRCLSLSRENAKAILMSGGFPQSSKTDERIGIVLACRGLSMTDSFWIKEEDEIKSFDEVNLRNHHLKDAAYPISILGGIMSVSKDILAPDISTNGMYLKTWIRYQQGYSVIFKTDKTNGNINTKAEIAASEFLAYTNVEHVQYTAIPKDGLLIAASENLANDNVYLMDGYEFKDYCKHHGKDFLEECLNIDEDFFKKMCMIDYVIANTDRHLGNIQFIVDTNSNQIVGFAPLFDHNQSFIADINPINKDGIDDLIYEPTGLTFKETMEKYTDLDIIKLPEAWELEELKQHMKKKYNFDLTSKIDERIRTISEIHINKAFERE